MRSWTPVEWRCASEHEGVRCSARYDHLIQARGPACHEKWEGDVIDHNNALNGLLLQWEPSPQEREEVSAWTRLHALR